MNAQQAVEFVSAHHHAVLQTYRAGGSTQMSPIAVAASADGRLLISTRAPSMKARNIGRDPRCALCVLPDGFFGEWIQVDGTAEVVSLPDAMPLLEEAYRQIAGEHPDWDDFRGAMRNEQRVILRITIERAGPDRQG